MAKVIFVKSARARFDNEGVQKPLHKCDRCSQEIAVGDSYKHMSIKTGPRSSRQLVRCSACPVWEIWEYSNSVSARAAQIVHEAQEAIGSAEDASDVIEARDGAAEAIRELAEEKRESAQNIVDGFGHETYQSEELSGQADELDDWAQEIEGVDVSDPEDLDCEYCDGAGRRAPEADDDYAADDLVDGKIECPDCDGSGEGDRDEALDAWRDEVNDAFDVLQNSPV